MIINVGTQNVAKVKAVIEVLKEYEMFKDAEIVPMKAESNISEQPLSLDETIQGAINRTKDAFKDCDYSIGIESGLMKVLQAKSGYLNICACVIFDGKNTHLGLSSGFEYPKIAIERMLKDHSNISAAYKSLGFTEHDKIGNTEGAILGQLTKGRVTRAEYTKQAIRMALIHLENPELY
jgi:inosine/xanthosine triphosphatase